MEIVEVNAKLRDWLARLRIPALVAVGAVAAWAAFAGYPLGLRFVMSVSVAFLFLTLACKDCPARYGFVAAFALLVGVTYATRRVPERTIAEVLMAIYGANYLIDRLVEWPEKRQGKAR
ncbi:MAG TPA: hypothetical protein VFB38_11245 [Chthonomonadaceae bacterium]|nr:hypothetical protein [Chthonomonadaceae bacterium]